MAQVNEMPPLVVLKLFRKAFLFLGYSLSDWNLRFIFRDGAPYAGTIKAWFASDNL
jgi:hypothetical protein